MSIERRAFRLADLINRRRSSSLTEEEERELREWLEASPEHRRLLAEMRDPEWFGQKYLLDSRIEEKNACRAFKQRVTGEKRRLHLRWIRRIAVVAAVAALPIVFSWFFSIEKEMPVQEAVVVAESIPAGESRAVLVLADGREIKLQAGDTYAVEDKTGKVAEVSETGLAYCAGGQEEEETAWHCLRVPRNGEYMLELADKTKIWLNSESSVRYPVAFRGKERKIYLEGEAYLEVAKREDMPFVVESGQVKVEVLGTSFNFRAYDDEGIVQTTLVDGRVRMSAGGEALVLQPEEQGRVQLRDGAMDKQPVDVRIYTGWKEGRLIFEGQNLDMIMKTLARWYDLEVTFVSEGVKDIVFTGNLRRYDDFGRILSLLELACPVTFEVKGKTVDVKHRI